MTRAGKSYRSSQPKETKENKAERQKRLENYRIAKEQAKKFVIPGLVAMMACLFFLFVSMYGFTGSKLDRRLSAQEKVLQYARENGNDASPPWTADELSKQILERMANLGGKDAGEQQQQQQEAPVLVQEKKGSEVLEEVVVGQGNAQEVIN